MGSGGKLPESGEGGFAARKHGLATPLAIIITQPATLGAPNTRSQCTEFYKALAHFAAVVMLDVCLAGSRERMATPEHPTKLHCQQRASAMLTEGTAEKTRVVWHY